MSDDKIDTEIELEVYRLDCKKSRLNTLLKFGVMVLALIGATVLGGIYNADYLGYAFILYGIVITFAVGEKINGSTLLSKFTKK